MVTELILKLQQNRKILEIPNSEDKWDMIHLMEAIINTNSMMSKPVGDRRMIDIAILFKKSKQKDIPMIFGILMGYKKFHTIQINYHVNGRGETAFFTLPDALFVGVI